MSYMRHTAHRMTVTFCTLSYISILPTHVMSLLTVFCSNIHGGAVASILVPFKLHIPPGCRGNIHSLIAILVYFRLKP